ncbi:hypothetical protein COC42_00625 [Sphingomonas spermidinifaciens]|uniref:Uncharacterized protein n=1 Tax=Sphingomonas spermidinifaciens TaxID=1141889 RepID=A0A2A4B5G1_9SPHN|nr:hypothetical protein [Sphingomonas spermidinifaciens]PCD02978.1 hypothetical protein COC42_00625 [Sphingomonas spermidinifaciens]
MHRLRSVLSVLGLVVALLGILWMLQGLGIVGWPASSFMIGDQVWVTIGSAVAAAGVLLILIGRRLR